MSDFAIRVEQLSKRYRIGLKEEMHDTLAGAVADFVKRPLQNLQRLRRLSQFDSEEGADVLWALKDVSFDVQAGEVVGIIGRNGAGKSTLLKILSRITHPTSGRVELRGRVSSLLEVGTGFHPELTGRENIYLNGTILGMTKTEIDQKFDEIVDFSGVEKFIDTPVKRYSSGMRVRLAFSVAAHLEPEILLIDEVLAVGDAEFQKKCLGKMGDVAKEGRTVLFVSHNMGAIRSLCSRSLVIENGQIIIDGNTNDAVDSYLTKISGQVAEGNQFQVYEKTGQGFMDVWFENSLGRTTSSISGDAINICLEYHTTEPKFDWGLTLYNNLNDPILHFGSQFSRRERSPLPPRGVITCEIPSLPLPEGRYRLNAAMNAQGKTMDHIIGAAFLDIHPGNFFGTGRVPPSSSSKFYLEHRWRVR